MAGLKALVMFPLTSLFVIELIMVLTVLFIGLFRVILVVAVTMLVLVVLVLAFIGRVLGRFATGLGP